MRPTEPDSVRARVDEIDAGTGCLASAVAHRVVVITPRGRPTNRRARRPPRTRPPRRPGRARVATPARSHPEWTRCRPRPHRGGRPGRRRGCAKPPRPHWPRARGLGVARAPSAPGSAGADALRPVAACAGYDARAGPPRGHFHDLTERLLLTCHLHPCQFLADRHAGATMAW